MNISGPGGLKSGDLRARGDPFSTGALARGRPSQARNGRRGVDVWGVRGLVSGLAGVIAKVSVISINR